MIQFYKKRKVKVWIIRLNIKLLPSAENMKKRKESQNIIWRCGKRCLDAIGSAFLLFSCFPILLVISLGVKLFVPGSVLFRQKRIGMNRVPFVILKFRTIPEKKAAVNKISRVGAFLRRTKLDELPQLVNILCGEMSFVGPRPYIPEESAGLPAERFAVRPGLTGLAQVNGNTFLSWERRTAYDLEYVHRGSFRMDCGILAKTVKVVLQGEKACISNRRKHEIRH